MTRRSALRPRALLACAAVLGTAGFLVWAVGFGEGPRTLPVPGPPAPQASAVAVNLASAIGRANLGRAHRAVDMARVAPFAWDRVYVFAGETSADIRRRLGFDWPDAPAAVPRPGQHESLLVFVRGRSVAGSAFFSDAIGRLDCLTAQAGYPRGTRFVVRFARRRPPQPYLTTARPDGVERLCLRSVGIRRIA